MAEREYSINLPDNKKMYVVENKNAGNRRAVIHVHGLTGWNYDYAATRMALTFPAQGYDVYRPNLYDWKDGARKLTDCTIAVHADDVMELVKELRGHYDKIFLTGHSYGGPVLLSLDQNRVDGISLWDATLVPGALNNSQWGPRPWGDVFIKGGSFDFIVSKAFVDEAAIWDDAYAKARFAAWVKPLQLIQADGGYWIKYEGGKEFYKYAGGPSDYRVIAGTEHCFVEEGTTEQLLDATKEWFDRFNPAG
jgi:alpha-beta hydrolase superfamily lysophospholipase